MRHRRLRFLLSQLALTALLLALGALLTACPTRRGGDDDDNGDDDDAGDDDDVVEPSCDDIVGFDGSGLPEGANAPREAVCAKIISVYDGDTATMDLADWGQQTVRFLNIDTPELSSNDCWADEATERTQELLPVGSLVWLTWDGELTDQFDRLLCHIFAGETPGYEDWINLQLVAEGHAEAFIFEANDTYEDEFNDAEWNAWQQGLGLWGECY